MIYYKPVNIMINTLGLVGVIFNVITDIMIFQTPLLVVGARFLSRNSVYFYATFFESSVEFLLLFS